MTSSASTMINLSTPDSVFAAAIDSFRGNLSKSDEENFQSFDTPDAMIKNLRDRLSQATKNDRGKTSRLLTACTKVDTFCKSLEPYFEAVSILVSSHPDWAAIAWGVIRLVFILSSNFVTFFEKLADMLERINLKLRLWEVQVNVLRQRLTEKRSQEGNAKWQSSLDCLSKSMSYVYADIIQFCSDGCRLLPKAGMKIRQKAGIVRDLLWTPFDTRFSKTLARLEEHSTLVHLTLQSVLSEQLIQNCRSVDLEIQRNSNFRQGFDVERDQKKMDALKDKVAILRCWIGAPEWVEAYDAAERRRLEHTGNWIFDQVGYKSWLASPSVAHTSCSSSFSSRFLVLSAKPGYGKTILSINIIENLRTEIAKNSSNSKKGIVAYFHFEKLQVKSRKSNAALRSVLTQLLQARQTDTDFVDVASILYNNGEGQCKSSEKEVKAILEIFFRQMPPSYLVFDALDECEDWEDFLESLAELTMETQHKIVLLARPHLDVQNTISQNVYHVALEAERNVDDIERYLKSRIEKLMNKGAIPATFSVGAIVSQLSRRTNSMFLWAVLMANYLSSPYLTPTERSTAIHQLNRFEGLDAIYARILEELEHRIPYAYQIKVKHIFEWLSVAKSPWTTEVVRTALAVQPDRPLSEHDYIQNFEAALLQMCGSLIEVRNNGTVDFIHLSVLEFLQETHNGNTKHRVPTLFRVRNGDAESSMTNLCLSYMINDVPHRPLAGSYAITTSRDIVASRLPLLEYAAKNWTAHAGKCLPAFDMQDLYEILYASIYTFITTQSLVSVWIEASWLFGNAPNVDALMLGIGPSVHSPGLSLADSHLMFRNTISQFAETLARIYHHWNHILVTEPNEIWGPSIQAWSKPAFVAENNSASIISLSSNHNADAILIATQVSHTGTEIGVMKVQPPRTFGNVPKFTLTNSTMDEDCDSLNFIAIYEILSLETRQVKFRIQFEVPTWQISRGVVHPGCFDDESTFQLPVKFSPSLRSIVVVDTIVKIVDSLENSQEVETQSQTLMTPACQHTSTARLSTRIENRQQRVSKQSKVGHQRHSVADHRCYSWFRYAWSRDEHYLAILEGDGFGITSSWVLTVYENTNGISSQPDFSIIQSIRLQFSPFVLGNWTQFSHEDYVSFHPHEPIIAFCPSSIVALWRFKETRSKLIELSPVPLRKLTFSTCGRFLYGVKDATGTPIILNVPLENHSSSSIVSAKDISSLSNPGSEFGQTSNETIAHPAKFLGLSQGFQGTDLNKLDFTNSQDQVYISSLEQHHQAGAITFQGLAGGSLMTATLARTPKSNTLQKSYCTLVESPDDSTIRFAMNMAAQSTYHAKSKPDVALPLIIDQRRDAIFVNVQSLPHRISDKSRKRPLEDGDQGSAPLVGNHLRDAVVPSDLRDDISGAVDNEVKRNREEMRPRGPTVS